MSPPPPSAVPAEVVSVPQVTADACIDDSFPRLVGDWVVHCGPEGRVDRAWNLATRVGVTLGRAVESPVTAPAFRTTSWGAGDGGGPAPLRNASPGDIGPSRTAPVAPAGGDAVLWSPDAGAWRLGAALVDGAVVQPGGDWPHLPPAAGPRGAAYADDTAVVVDGRGVDAFAEGVRARSLTPATPARGQRVAATVTAGGLTVVWVERDTATGLDLWMRTPDGARVPLAVGPGDAWRPVARAGFIVWVEDGAVVRQDVTSGARVRFPAHTGFLDDPTLDDGVACWSDRGALVSGGDIDVRCSDGFVLARAGHQLHPSRSGARMIVREGARLLLVTLPASAVASGGDDGG